MGIPLSHPCASCSSWNTTTDFPPLYFRAFLLSWWSLRKSEWKRDRESATSAIVASALLWLGFPLFRWKIKVLPGETLRICDLWLVLQRFFQRSLIMRGENQVVQAAPEGLKQRQMSDCWRFIAGVLCFIHFVSRSLPHTSTYLH